MGLVKTRRLAAMQKQQRAKLAVFSVSKLGKKDVKPWRKLDKSKSGGRA